MPVQVPFTTTVSNHGLLIQTAGEVIGAITAWSPRQTRAAQPVFEFGGVTTGGGGSPNDIQGDSGEPYEIVPGNIGGTEIQIRRYDLYTKRFETAFGTNNLHMLTRQQSPLKFIEFTTGPEPSLNFSDIYYGAWFTSLGREHNADQNRIVMANATAMYTRKRPA